MNNSRERNEKPRNFEITVPLIDLEVYKKPYDSSQQITTMIENISWPLIDIPIQCFRSLVLNDPSAKGNTTVGYIKDYDAENKTFSIVIFSKFGDIISEFEDVVVFPRTSRMEDVVRISSMLIGPTSSFEYVTKLPMNNNRNKGYRN